MNDKIELQHNMFIEVNGHYAFKEPKLIRKIDIKSVRMEGFDVGPWEDSGSYDGYSFEIVFELRNGETITETYNPLSLENALCQPTLWDELNKIGIHNYTWEDIDDFESGNVIAKRMRDRRYQRIMNQLCEN